MYAVIRTGSKQYCVEPGVELLVEKLAGAEEGSTIALDDVLMYVDGADVTIGTPRVPMAVHCKVVADVEKGDKLHTIKYRRRHNYRRKMGHRQQYTRLFIEKFEKKGN